VWRGDTAEAVHHVHAASTAGDRIGDAGLVCHLRSSMKPLQAIPLLEGFDDLKDEELAIASASHEAEPAQLEAVRTLLARAEATEDDLELGLQPGRLGKISHNCSGKHAGMLAACRAHGWSLHPYRDLEHPLQRRIVELVGPGDVAIDGCGVPTVAVSLDRMAELFTTIPPRIVEAMLARPELVGGSTADDTDLMLALPGWIAKRGAEGLFCALSPDGVGWAFKVADGSTRALRPAIGQALELDAFRTVAVRNSLGEVVGSIQ